MTSPGTDALSPPASPHVSARRIDPGAAPPAEPGTVPGTHVVTDAHDATGTGTGPPRRTGRGQPAREALLAAAERLFAERGLDSVSHRQISVAAGQGNIAAVNYHFGTTEDLVREIVRRHADRIEAHRARMVARVAGSADLRDWVECFVRPLAAHLDALGAPTWYARLHAQVATDPRYRHLLEEVRAASPSVEPIVAGVIASGPDLPEPVRSQRSAMVRLLMIHTLAERETAIALGQPTPQPTWAAWADGLVDALVGLWLAPVTVPPADATPG